ncbi:GNAT family N-acetyltransferase [Streptomyces sp. PA03-6a]|nr:GNAT family N-acetyltransferase [Streptomyces sp. PA03-6a]
MGRVLVVVHEGHVAGVIGARRLMPQHYGVRRGHRGRGYGRALWWAAMDWGSVHGA